MALLNQCTTFSYKVIVVDDASKDTTAAIVKQLQFQFSNLQLLRHEVNRGRGAARRTGQDATGARWIGFVDADIVVPQNWMKRCLEELLEVDGVSGIAQPDGDCAVIWRVCQPTIRKRPGSAEITGNNVIFSRNALEVVPFSPSAKLGEDFRIAKLMIQKGYRLRTIDDLKVEHQESKTYLGALSWMWKSGADASSLLFEFRIIRLPDLAWITWLSVFLVTLVGAAIAAFDSSLCIVATVVMTLVISWTFIWSRFTPRRNLIRFLAALTISPPMVLAYLAGRTTGLFQIPYRLIHTSVRIENQ